MNDTQPSSEPQTNQTQPVETSTHASTATQRSGTSFKNLLSKNDLINSLANIGIHEATRAQAACIPLLLSGRDVILQAQTGSGKTFAYTLPLLERLESMEMPTRTYALIVTPTRELATQVKSVMQSLGSSVTPCCLIGGANMKEQQEALRKDARVVIGTPGRILDFIRQRELRLRKCEYIVLDEADEMLSMGFIEDVRSILARLPDKRQGAFISATINPRVQMLARSFLKNPEHIVIESDTSSGANIEHLYCDVGAEITARVTALCDLIETQRPRSTIIFCNTKSDTELVEVYLRRRGFDACRINSDLNQKQRDKIMQRMRDGSLSILVATDVAARGIDIDNIDVVFNYSVPQEIESYVHRTGRTARAGTSGKAITLVSPHDFQTFFLFKKEFQGDFKKLDLPDKQEIVEASLAHFYERLREVTVPVSEKTKTLAKKILIDLSDGTSEPSDELQELLTKLIAFTEQQLEPKEVVIEEEARTNTATNSDKETHSQNQRRNQSSKGRRNTEKQRSGNNHRRRENKR